MKRYTHYRLVLLIGLFSLHTLFACVHTRKELGACPTNFVPNGSDKQRLCIRGFLSTMFILTAGGLYSVISNLTHPTDAHNIKASGNTIRSLIPTNLTTISKRNASIILSSITPTQGEFILNATQVDPGKLAINGKQFELTTDAEPADGVTVKNPMVLEEHILKDIMGSGFLTKRIQYWLNRGLNIDAKEADAGSTLLAHAIWANNTCATEFIIDQGADVNISNKYGETPTMAAVLLSNYDIAKRLIKNKQADVCKKDINGQTARDLTENISNFDTQTRIYNKLTEAMKKQQCTSYANGG